MGEQVISSEINLSIISFFINIILYFFKIIKIKQLKENQRFRKQRETNTMDSSYTITAAEEEAIIFLQRQLKEKSAELTLLKVN